MRKTVLLGLLCLIAGALYAQEAGRTAKLTGKVVDSATNTPLEYATITLKQLPQKKAVNGAASDKSGRFSISDIAPGAYEVTVDFLGYATKDFPQLQLEKGATLDLKTVILSKKAVTLQTVTVASSAKLIDNRIDKLVYNAEKDITSQAGVATDILRKVPQVSVDVEGNVQLAGNSSVRFLINGKPSAAFGSSVADVLQALPASQIKSIEVVTNPGAKYDAQGTAGIINIILKKSTAEGINGNLSLSAGTRANNGSFNFNARRGNFGANAFISGNDRPTVNTPSTLTRFSRDTAAKTHTNLEQSGLGYVSRNSYQTGIGFDWTVQERHNLSGSFSYDQFHSRSGSTINQHQTISSDMGGMPVYSRSLNNNTNRFKLHNIDAELTYKYNFPKEDQELEIAAYTSTGKTVARAATAQQRVPGNNLYYGNNNTNPSTETETEVTADYTHPLKEDVLLGIGGKYNQDDIRSRSEVNSYQSTTGDYKYNASLSNSLKYHQQVYALYAELSFPVGKAFDAKLGSRYERTEIQSYYSNAQTQVKRPGYNTVVPSIFLSKKLGEKQTVKLSYSKRIERPDYNDLNPFINTTDPKNIAAGNPYLLPEVGHRIEAGYNLGFGNGSNIAATVFYRLNEDDIQPFIRYYPSLQVGDSVYTAVSVSSRENIGTEKNTGANLFADLRIGAKLTLRSNLSAFHRYIINKQDPGYNIKSFNYRANLNATYQFTGNLVAEGFGNFSSARNEAQGKYPSFATYSFAIRAQFWNKKGSLALTASNPFNKYVNQRTELFGPNFNTTSYRQMPYRSFGINFTWKFGKLEFKKEHEESDAPADAGVDGGVR